MRPVWKNVVKLNFKNNKIRHFQNIKCLVRLDFIDLQGNMITHVSNDSFSDLSNLRSINFANNRIRIIDPAVIGAPLLNLLTVNLSRNEMKIIDAMNMMSLYPFCSIDMSHNNITNISNVNNYILDTTGSYGPGFTSLTYNEIEQFPNFQKLLKMESWNQLGILIGLSVDFTNNPTNCDCTYEPYMSLAEEIVHIFMQDHFKVICQSPPDLAELEIKEVPLDRLVCPVEAQSGCKKPECLCIDEPNKNQLFINCSYSNLDEMPVIPYSEYSKYIYLNISGNNIKEINDVLYLSDISVLDISENDIYYIDPQIARKIENVSFLDISNNPRLRQLPQIFQHRDVCSTYMRNLKINCNCESKWIRTWLQSRTCKTNDHLFTCDVPNHGQMPALSFNEDLLECFPSTNLFLLAAMIAGTLLLLLILLLCMYYFRYEMLIMFVRLWKSKSNKIVPCYKYDVYVSYNDQVDDVRQWVERVLLNHLTEDEYAVYLPNRDLKYGEVRDEQISIAIANARNVLVVLSDNYLEYHEEGLRPWTENEWKYGWNNFKTHGSKNIVLVNFGHCSPSEVEHPQMRAYLRVGCTVDFKNYSRCIIQEIYTKLGKPSGRPRRHEKVFKNKNLKFTRGDLFVIDPAFNDDRLYTDDKYNIAEKQVITKANRNNRMSENKIMKNSHSDVIRNCQFRKCIACQHLNEKRPSFK